MMYVLLTTPECTGAGLFISEVPAKELPKSYARCFYVLQPQPNCFQIRSVLKQKTFQAQSPEGSN